MDQGRRKRRGKVLEKGEKQPLKLFLDSSVLLSASGSTRSLSRLILEAAPHRRWDLVTASYCVAEVNRNVIKFGEAGILAWGKVKPKIRIVPNALVSNRPLLLAAAKDKPVLISALASESNYLLTLDIADFGIVLNTSVYGMRVATPRQFLVEQGIGP
jgi:predicted nucleic acid-binding protein